MPQVICVTNKKGGCGKTTIAINLSAALAAEGREVLLIDADPQASTMTWRSAAQERPLPFSVVALPRPVLHEEVKKLRSKYKLIVLDCPPAAEEIIRSALIASDLALIPVQPSPFDMWGADDMLTLIGSARALNPTLTYKLIVSRRILSTRLAGSARDSLLARGFECAQTQIAQRIALAESAIAGQTILEYHTESPAAAEFAALAKEVLNGQQA